MAHFELRPKPPLIDAVTGNGHLLLTLGRTGEPYRLFWPHIDYGQHLDRWLEGVYLPGHTERAVWQDAPGWLHSQRYEGETALVSSRSEHPGLGLAVERLDAVAPRGMVGSGDSDLWLRRVRVTNIGPVALPVTYLLFQSLWFEESPLYRMRRKAPHFSAGDIRRSPRGESFDLLNRIRWNAVVYSHHGIQIQS